MRSNVLGRTAPAPAGCFLRPFFFLVNSLRACSNARRPIFPDQVEHDAFRRRLSRVSGSIVRVRGGRGLTSSKPARDTTGTEVCATKSANQAASAARRDGVILQMIMATSPRGVWSTPIKQLLSHGLCLETIEQSAGRGSARSRLALRHLRGRACAPHFLFCRCRLGYSSSAVPVLPSSQPMAVESMQNLARVMCSTITVPRSLHQCSAAAFMRSPLLMIRDGLYRVGSNQPAQRRQTRTIFRGR